MFVLRFSENVHKRCKQLTTDKFPFYRQDFRNWAVIIVVILLSISGIAESGSEAASVGM